MESLRTKSIHQLRAIAQGFGIGDIFAKDSTQLIQAIELKQEKMIPEPSVLPPRPEYDARLMTRPPSKSSNQSDVMQLLSDHVARGLHLSFPDEEHWEMKFDKRTDTGHMRIPLRVILNAAEKLMK